MEAALGRGGHLTAAHQRLLEHRRAEGNRELWAAAGELGPPTRTYFARLVSIEDALGKLPVDQPGG